MAEFDFDKEIDRHGTDCLKYDFAEERGRPKDVLPLWVADMDFQAPPCVNEALERAARFGIYGYTETKGEYNRVVCSWFDRRFDWHAKEEWLIKTPGVVYALAMAVRAFTEIGDGILIQPPVYYPFYDIIRDNGRRIVENPLVLSGGRYEIDFEDFERKIVFQNVKLFILCSPHNPVGRVWSETELKKLGEICLKHGVLVASDEIHCDIVLPGHKHRVFSQVNPQLNAKSVICTAPSKTFNVAGLQNSNIFIPDEGLRKKFKKEIDKTGYSQLNMMGIYACKAAYCGGERWLEECLKYLGENLEYLRKFLKEQLPCVHLIEPEGTYFAWLDFSSMNLKDDEINDLVTNKAKLWLDAGRIFGRQSGSGFQRLNYACTKETLKKALEALKTAVEAET